MSHEFDQEDNSIQHVDIVLIERHDLPSGRDPLIARYGEFVGTPPSGEDVYFNFEWECNRESEMEVDADLLQSISDCLSNAIEHGEFMKIIGPFGYETSHFYMNHVDHGNPRSCWIWRPVDQSRAWFLERVCRKLEDYVSQSGDASSTEALEAAIRAYWKDPKKLRDPNVTLESVRQLDPFATPNRDNQ